MSDPHHLAMLLQGADAWNSWRALGADSGNDPQDGSAVADSPKAIDLSGADLRGLDLSGALLSGVTLQAANLSDADLRNCDLTDADLALSDLSGANLGGAQFARADFSGARLDGAWLQEADLSEALGLTSAQIGLALFSDKTRLPPYLIAALDEENAEFFNFFGADEPFGHLSAVDIYDLLGVSAEASADEISKAFRNLAKKYHPDVNQGDTGAERRFAQISEAYRFALTTAKTRVQLEARRSNSWAVSATLAVLALALPIAGAAAWLYTRPATVPLEKTDLVTHATAPAVTPPAAPRSMTPAVAPPAATPPAAPPVATPAASPPAPLPATPAPLPATREASTALLAADSGEDDTLVDPDGGAALMSLIKTTTPSPAPSAAVTAQDPDRETKSEPAPEPAAPAAFSQPWEEEWQSLRSSTDLRALQNYIQRYPDRHQAQEAREKFRSTLDATADVGVLSRVASDMPGSAPEATMVNQKLAALVEKESLQDDSEAWSAAKEAGTVAAYRAYLLSYPTGRYVEAANRRLDALQEELRQRRADDAAWGKTRREKTTAAYERYLKAFPTGAHAADAERELAKQNRAIIAQKKEDEVWNGTRKANTPDAFQSYLKAYPKGRYALAAKMELVKAEVEAASTPAPSLTSTPRPRTQPGPARALRFPSSDEPFVETFPRP